ncbi:MAG: sigma-70 family RNA polymerase sigma factor [Planctomycetes bacterium]|nr:sigma-70 family RNA polymerase sigma factor [Planctomycetota bacterium]
MNPEPPPRASEDAAEEELVRRAVAGEREAQDRLFAAHLEPVHAWVRQRLGPQLRARVDTQDLAQSSLAEAFRDLGGFEWRGRESFRRWLRRIVENKIRQKAIFFRRRKRDAGRELRASEDSTARSPAELGVEPRTPSHILDRRDELAAVERAMERLPQEYREVVRMARLEHMPYREIGERMGGRSEDAVRKLLMRAMLKLTQLVDDERGGAAAPAGDGGS